ncbi:putative aldehyde dehydrogenase [Coniochaeta sp. 2T2.1]|nr:putative aldehyde dehydrogenase [Coniochaeta sp. 2T2.1]
MAESVKEYESRLFINNSFVAAKSGRSLDVFNPYNGSRVGSVQVAGPDDVDAAVLACEADLVEKRIPEISRAQTLSMGAPIMFMQHFLGPWIVAAFKSMAGYADKIQGESFTDQEDGVYKIVEWGPAGVCAAIGTWNGGLAYFATYVGSAVASGNTIVYKASEKSPFDVILIAELIAEAGFPPGVINIVSGDGETGALLASHMQIRVLAFTGSPRTGKIVAELAAKSNMKKTILELGGKAAGIIFDDCNMDNALETCATRFVAISGQICTASTRLLVQSTVVEDFTRKIKDVFAKMETVLGSDPLDPSTGVGTLADEKQLHHVLQGLDMGKKHGTVLIGGSRKGSTGNYVQPTIFVDVNQDTPLWREEIYGPVLLIKTFQTEEEAIELANDTEYGLAAQIFTRDIARAIRVARKMEAGIVSINSSGIGDNQAPFGGTKGSGHGRTGGLYGVREFMESKTIKINMHYDG